MGRTKENIKGLAFFGNDRTINVHVYPRNGEDAESRSTEYLHDFSTAFTEREVRGDRPLMCMQWYMNKLRSRGYKIFCLSYTLSNLRDEYNKNFLLKYYGADITYLTVNDPSSMAEMILAVAEYYGVPTENCELIEDRMSTLYDIAEDYAESRIKLTHISDVMADFEEMLLRETGDLIQQVCRRDAMAGDI